MANFTTELQKIRPKYRLEIILDDLDFSWSKREIQNVMALWNSGFTIPDIARIVKPLDIKNGEDEVTLLIIHLSRHKKIKRRKGKLII